MNILGLGVCLILAGLAICWLSSTAGTLARPFWWAGILLAVLGLLLVLLPVLNYIAAQLKQALGVGYIFTAHR